MTSERPEQAYIDTFWKLASNDPEERVAGCSELISATDSDVKWNYGIKRLVKGLASPKPSARLGFSTALTEFVSLPFGLTMEGYFDLLNEHLPLASGMKSKEIRNTLLGRLFGIQAISGSQLLQVSDSEGFQRFVDYAVDLSVKKAWLRELAFFAMVQFIKRTSATDGSTFAEKDYIIQKLQDSKLDKTPEAVAIYLTIGGGEWDPLAKSNATELGKILKDVSSPQDDDNSKQKGNWSPKPNFVWPMILQRLCEIEADKTAAVVSEKETKKSKKDKKDKKSKKSDKSGSSPVESDLLTLPVFWNIVVDQSLFAQSSSPERKYWGFEILQLALGIVGKDQVGLLFTPNLLRTLINQLGSSDRLLNKAAKHVVAKLVELTNSSLGPEIIKALLINPGGSLNFDRLTKTKTVQSMLANIELSAVGDIVSLLKQVFVAPDEKAGKALDGKRQWALDQMLALVRRFQAESLANADVEWIDDILRFMIRYGFFKDTSGKKRKLDESEFVPLSHRTVNDCLTRFNSVLSAVLNTTRPDRNTWAYTAWNYVSTMMTEYELIYELAQTNSKSAATSSEDEDEDEDMDSEDEDSGAVNADDEVLEIKDKSIKTLDKIRHLRLSPHGDNALLKSFEILFSLVLLQLYQQDEESVGVLSDLLECYGKIREEDDEVLTDIIVSFISRRSALLKKMVDVVWEGLVLENKVNMQLIFDVLKTEENVKGQEKLFGEEGEEGEDEEESEVEEFHGTDDEAEEDKGESNESDGDDESEDDSEEEEDSDDDSKSLSHNDISEADRKLTTALADALGTKEEAEDDSDYDSDSSMDDDQMLALDSQLAAIFKERAQTEGGDDDDESGKSKKKSLTKNQLKKKEAAEAKESIVQFKHKALDLISVYLKSYTNREWSLEIFECGFILLHLVGTTKDRALSDKTQTVLKQRLYKLRYQNFVAEDAESELEELLAKCHDQAIAAANPGHASVLAGMSMLVSKALAERGQLEQVVRQYGDTMLEWISKPKSRLQASMFFDLANWAGDLRKRKDVKVEEVEEVEE